MRGQIPDYDQTDPARWKKKPNTRAAMLALVGMHVVGSARNHPEMIWATFEHVCNAPGAAYTYNGATPNKTAPANSGPWLFSSTGTPAPANVKRQSYNALVSPPQIEANTAQMAYPHTVGPADLKRLFPWGMPGNSTASNTEILAANHSVLSQLAPGDLRANYIMTGSTWTIGGSINGTQVGTNHAANVTMETYVQGTTNCLDCHNNLQGNPDGDLGSPDGSGVSHIFGEIKPLP